MSKTVDVETVSNGFVLTIDGEKFVCQTGKDQQENFADMVYALMDRYLDNQGKYSEKRLYLIEAPGFDSELWDELWCPLCGREPEKAEE